MNQQISKEESLANCVRRIHGQSSLPAFSHHMAELTRAMGDESTTLNLLTNLILKSVSLSAQVLRLANSVHYNPRGKPILSVSRAVTMMGWDSIRNMGAGVLLFEHFHKQSDQLKELTLLMLLTGNHARQLAIRSGMRGIEEAYLCGMFRNLGELIVACYFPDDYTRVLECASETKSTPTDACERLLRFRFEDLGKRLAQSWNLPDTVGFCMETPDLIVPDAQSDAERLRIISSFSHALSEITYRTDRNNSQDALKALLNKYRVALPVKEHDVAAILEAAVFETEDTLRPARLLVDRARLTGRIGAVTGGDKAIAIADPSTPPADFDVLKSLMSELRSMLDSDEEFDLNAVIMMTLEAIYRGIRFDRALFCLVTGDHDRIEARLGVGADVEPLIAKFQFPISLRSGPIGSALLRKEDLIVESGAVARYGRSTFLTVTGACCFGILPLIVDGIVAGCLYFDSASEKFPLDSQNRQALNTLKRLAVGAITRKRRAPRPLAKQ